MVYGGQTNVCVYGNTDISNAIDHREALLFRMINGWLILRSMQSDLIEKATSNVDSIQQETNVKCAYGRKRYNLEPMVSIH